MSDKSLWVQMRNAVEAMVQPEIQEGINFFHALESLEKSDIAGELKDAAVAGYSAIDVTPGGYEAKALAGVAAFASALLGETILLVKKAAAVIETAPAPSPAPEA